MLQQVVATKLGMTQAWTVAGKRLAVTRCRVDRNCLVSLHNQDNQKNTGSADNKADAVTFELGYGIKKAKNMSKPLRSKLTKANLKEGVFALKGVKVTPEGDAKELIGTHIKVEEVLTAGDVVQVQGTSKGRGFAGGMKRHGFHGGPKTHGQSDRARAVGSIGAGTSPGKVWKGKKMPGHYGVETKTVTGLVVLFVDSENQEVWLNGPIPGSYNAYVTIRKTGKNKQIELDSAASNLPQPSAEPQAEAETSTTETVEETAQNGASSEQESKKETIKA